MRKRIKNFIKGNSFKKRNPTDLISASSFENGIRFNSSKKCGSYIISTWEEGKVNVRRIEKNSERLYLAIIIFFLIIAIVLKIYEEEILLFVKDNIKLIIRGYATIYCLGYFINILRSIKNDSLKKFHGAEHMVVNAYYNLQRLPETLEEVQKFSIIHKKCGTNFATEMCLITLILFIGTFIELNIAKICIIALSIGCVVVLFAMNKMSFFQYLTAKEPTAKELEVALKGLKEWERFEKE